MIESCYVINQLLLGKEPLIGIIPKVTAELITDYKSRLNLQHAKESLVELIAMDLLHNDSIQFATESSMLPIGEVLRKFRSGTLAERRRFISQCSNDSFKNLKAALFRNDYDTALFGIHFYGSRLYWNKAEYSNEDLGQVIKTALELILFIHPFTSSIEATISQMPFGNLIDFMLHPEAITNRLDFKYTTVSNVLRSCDIPYSDSSEFIRDGLFVARSGDTLMVCNDTSGLFFLGLATFTDMWDRDLLKDVNVNTAKSFGINYMPWEEKSK